MVVDDDPVVLATLTDWLTEMGCVVLTREESLGTLAAIAKEHPHVVILDVSMPTINGDRLAELIASNPLLSGVKLLFHSSKPARELAALVKRYRALGSIQKTGKEEHFIREFRRLVFFRADRTTGSE